MTIELADLPGRIQELQDRLRSGEAVVLTDQGATVGRVVPEPPPAAKPRRRGFAKGVVTWMAPDFDAPFTFREV